MSTTYKMLKDKRLILRKGDEWKLKTEFKHNGDKRRRWRKVTEVGAHVGDFSKSDFRRPL